MAFFLKIVTPEVRGTPGVRFGRSSVCCCCILILMSLGIFSVEVFATDYYLDSAAPSGGNGLSPATAWNFINAVSTADNNKFKPGDRIKFKRGSTFYGSLWIRWSGEPGNPIVFESYDDGNPSEPLPVIDGTKGVAVSWKYVEGKDNLYMATPTREPKLIHYAGSAKPPLTMIRLNSAPPVELAANAILLLSDPYGSFWVKSVSGNTVFGITRATMHVGQSLSFRYVEGGVEKNWSGNDLTIQEIVSAGDTARDGLKEEGDWYWDTVENRLYLYAATLPSNDTVQVSYFNDLIRVDLNLGGSLGGTAHDIVIQDLTVQKSNIQGVVLFNCKDVTVQRLNISGNARTGIQMWNANHTIVQNNTITFNSGAISLYAPSGEQTQYNQVLNNTISNCWGPCIGISRDQAANPEEVSENIISGNTISAANTMYYDGAGVYTFYAGANTIDSNEIHNCGSLYLRSAGVMVDMGVAPMTITNNTIDNNSNGGIVVSGAGHIISDNTLCNNGISTMNRPQIGFFSAGDVASSCTVTNNTIQADSSYHFITAESGNTSGHVIDYNTYNGQATGQFLWPPTSGWMDFETWQTTTGHDLNGSQDTSVSCGDGSFPLFFLPAWIH